MAEGIDGQSSQSSTFKNPAPAPAAPAPAKPKAKPKPAAPGTATSSVVQVISAVAHQLGIPVELALAIAQQESGLNPNSVGDGGTSFGLYQLHEGGELGSHNQQWANDPHNNALTALTEVARVYHANPSLDWGTIAAMAQRPADRAGYAQAVNAIAHQAGTGQRALTYYDSAAGHSAATAAGNLSAPTTAQTAADYAAGLSETGFAEALLRSNPELNGVFQQAFQNNWSASQFVSHVEDTTWFRSRSTSQRQYDELRYSDPQQWERALLAEKHKLSSVAVQMGIPVTSAVLSQLAQNTLRNGLTDQEVSSTLSGYFSYKPGAAYTGQVGATINDIQKMSSDYYVPVSNHTMQTWAQQSAAGNLDPNTLTDYFKQQAESLFPYLKPQLDAGHTVATIADPYRQLMAQTLEIDPTGIANNDKSVMGALQSKDAKGQLGLMPLWQFQEQLRSDPRWLHTDNARNSMLDTASGLLKDWGLLA